MAVVWHPIDLAAGASAGGPQGTEAPGPLGFLGAEGQSASRVREPRDKEPADVEKDKGFQKQGVTPTTRDTTPEGQVRW